MTLGSLSPAPLVDWAVAGRPLRPGSESGDQCLVASYPGGVLLGLVDGLGHGPDAATAARVAVASLASHPGQPLSEAMRLCHEALRRTRGGVVTLASFDMGGALTWLGVGNVEALLVRRSDGSRVSLGLRGGVVGCQLPSLHPVTVSAARGDVLLLASDGVRSQFGDGIDAEAAPPSLAAHILAKHGKDTDDALVLVARYLGGPP